MKIPALKLLFPLLLGCALSVSIMLFSERSHQRLIQANLAMAGSIETQAVASEVFALVADAETAQRGFFLTDNRSYLEPYRVALPKVQPKLQRLAQLTEREPEQHAQVAQIAKLIDTKFSELARTLEVYDSAGPQQARALVVEGAGNRTMNQIREAIAALQEGERIDLITRSSRWSDDIALSRFGLAVITAFNLVLMFVIYSLARREIVLRERAREHLEEVVRERTAELTELTNNLQNVQEAEKSKLARDIHDELGSILVSARMDVSWVRSRIKEADPSAADKLTRAIGALDEGVQIKRRIIEDLRPTLLDNLGLGAAITWHVDQACARANVKCVVTVPEEDVMLPNHMSIALFRVVQEALTNLLRYSQASNAAITLSHVPGGLLLKIVDDGVGIAPEAQSNKLSHGINGMRQRIAGLSGTFKIDGTHGVGTVVEVFVPIPETTATPADATAAAHLPA